MHFTSKHHKFKIYINHIYIYIYMYVCMGLGFLFYFGVIFTFWNFYKGIVWQFSHWFYWNLMILKVCDKWIAIELQVEFKFEKLHDNGTFLSRGKLPFIEEANHWIVASW